MTTRIPPALRPMLPADAPVVAEIFRASIEELTAEDYNPAQQQAWMSLADDEAAFAARLAKQLTLIATVAREPAGFASLKGNDFLDMLYVHPRAAGQGVAKALCDALEVLAAARGAKAMTVDASDTAQPFFAHRGYSSEQRNLVIVNFESLPNTTMKKPLAAARQAIQ